MLIVSKVRVDADRDIVLMHNNSQFMCNDWLFTVCSLACVNGLWNFLHRFLPKIPTLTGKLHNKSVKMHEYTNYKRSHIWWFSLDKTSLMKPSTKMKRLMNDPHTHGIETILRHVTKIFFFVYILTFLI